MNIESCELYFLKIPLRVSFSHGAKTGRVFSDSVIVRLGSGQMNGYGEAVVRDYVSGSFATGEDYRQEATGIVSRFLAPLEGRHLSWAEASGELAALSCASHDFPFLCAVETALLDLACKLTAQEVYSVLGREPARRTVTYCGVLPILPAREAEKYLRYSVEIGLPSMKVKVDGDAARADDALGLSRGILGESFDIRVDANSSWPLADGPKLFGVCRRHGVRIIEQPFSDTEPAEAAMREARAEGYAIMADERVLSSEDLRALAAAGAYSIVNLRLSKNGGLTRVLALAEEARANGLSYQLGCMVGETGVLSALGRLAASLLAEPLYVEGSYDDLLLTENVTTRSLGFGRRGEAPVLRGQGIGCEVSPEKLAKLSVARVACR